MGMFPAYYLFNILLYILQVMHVIWFYMILRIIRRSFTTAQIERDDRSESEYDGTTPKQDTKDD